jgi:hypothetical protein
LGRRRLSTTEAAGSNGQVQIFSNNILGAANGFVYSPSGNNVTITGQHITDIPLSIIGDIGATANMFQVANSSSILFAIESNGVLVGNGAGLTSVGGTNFVLESAMCLFYNGI